MYKTRNLPNTRIDVADALRGIAVAGIILYHSVEHFDIFTQKTILHTLPCDQTVADVLAWLFSGKMYGVFAMLFGLSLFIMKYGFELNLRFNVFSGRLTQLLCLFILGMQLGRQRLFYNEGKNLLIWHKILMISATIVIALSFVNFGELEGWLKPIYNLIILLMIVSAVVSAWYAFEGVRRVLHHLCIFGRMSLTNYLLQSIIGCAIFCGYGLACYYKLGITYAVMVGLGMVIAQYCFARFWFASHQRGPLEGLWRKLTWI